MRRRVFAGVATVFTFTSALAERAEIVGYGATTCAQFLRDYHSDPLYERGYFAWAQGYMSAILMTRPPGTDERLRLTPAEFPVPSQLRFVREFCAQHEESEYADAVLALYYRLRSATPKSDTSR